MMRLFIAVGVLALAACQPAPQPATPVADAPYIPPAPSFAAVSDNARAVTGAVTPSAEPAMSEDAPPSMKLTGVNGLVYVTELLPDAADAASAIDWTVLFREEVVTSANPPRGAPSVQVHTITREDIPANAANGGFCGAQRTNYIAMATGLTQNGQSLMSIAAFSSNVWPPQTPDVLCGVYTYAPPDSPL